MKLKIGNCFQKQKNKILFLASCIQNYIWLNGKLKTKAHYVEKDIEEIQKNECSDTFAPRSKRTNFKTL